MGEDPSLVNLLADTPSINVPKANRIVESVSGDALSMPLVNVEIVATSSILSRVGREWREIMEAMMTNIIE